MAHYVSLIQPHTYYQKPSKHFCYLIISGCKGSPKLEKNEIFTSCSTVISSVTEYIIPEILIPLHFSIAKTNRLVYNSMGFGLLFDQSWWCGFCMETDQHGPLCLEHDGLLQGESSPSCYIWFEWGWNGADFWGEFWRQIWICMSDNPYILRKLPQ